MDYIIIRLGSHLSVSCLSNQIEGGTVKVRMEPEGRISHTAGIHDVTQTSICVTRAISG